MNETNIKVSAIISFIITAYKYFYNYVCNTITFLCSFHRSKLHFNGTLKIVKNILREIFKSSTIYDLKIDICYF